MLQQYEYFLWSLSVPNLDEALSPRLTIVGDPTTLDELFHANLNPL